MGLWVLFSTCKALEHLESENGNQIRKYRSNKSNRFLLTGFYVNLFLGNTGSLIEALPQKPNIEQFLEKSS